MIRKARRDGRGNEEREKREDEKGSHCFFKSSGYDKFNDDRRPNAIGMKFSLLRFRDLCSEGSSV